ncbi:uncharacterized protein [Physcomitrium patens]|nr:uncharacterized protein LOC112279826 [Physcomitrium patens]|eukprot:XP_024370337.1 uncharacterized protein LOC112279826 [Physcomitrella patens]
MSFKSKVQIHTKAFPTILLLDLCDLVRGVKGPSFTAGWGVVQGGTLARAKKHATSHGRVARKARVETAHSERERERCQPCPRPPHLLCFFFFCDGWHHHSHGGAPTPLASCLACLSPSFHPSPTIYHASPGLLLLHADCQVHLCAGPSLCPSAKQPTAGLRNSSQRLRARARVVVAIDSRRLVRTMAISMQELFYGESEPVYLVHYGRQRSSTSWGSHSYTPQPAMPELSRTSRGRSGLRRFDLMAPMCCAGCEDQVRDALYAVRGVQDVVCDPGVQRVTVTGYLEPVEGLNGLKQAKGCATFCSRNKQHRYEESSCQRSHRGQFEDRGRREYVQYNVREQRSHSDRSYDGSRSESYSRSLCPAYRDTARTHYMSVPNPTIATRVEREW